MRNYDDIPQEITDLIKSLSVEGQRLFACWVARRSLNRVNDKQMVGPAGWFLLDAAEQFVAGKTTGQELEVAFQAAYHEHDRAGRTQMARSSARLREFYGQCVLACADPHALKAAYRASRCALAASQAYDNKEVAFEREVADQLKGLRALGVLPALQAVGVWALSHYRVTPSPVLQQILQQVQPDQHSAACQEYARIIRDIRTVQDAAVPNNPVESFLEAELLLADLACLLTRQSSDRQELCCRLSSIPEAAHLVKAIHESL